MTAIPPDSRRPCT